MLIKLLSDSETMVHCATFLISLYGFILFMWWWWKNEWNASSVFKYMTLAFIGISISSAVELYAEYIRITDSVIANSMFMLTSLVWKYRLIPKLLAYTLIVTHMTYRIFFGQTISGRRADDNGDK